MKSQIWFSFSKIEISDLPGSERYLIWVELDVMTLFYFMFLELNVPLIVPWTAHVMAFVGRAWCDNVTHIELTLLARDDTLYVNYHTTSTKGREMSIFALVNNWNTIWEISTARSNLYILYASYNIMQTIWFDFCYI